MRKITFIITAFIAPIFFCLGQSVSDEFIDWHAERQLTWDDYKGKPDPSSDAAALTSTFLGIEYNIDQSGLSWKIQCRFSKPRSWGKAKTDYILQHERGHFDVAEIFARKLNQKMKEYRFNKNTYQKDLRKIYDDVTSEKEKFQDQYDSESDHSRNSEMQTKWTKKIAQMLRELEEFANYS